MKKAQVPCSCVTFDLWETLINETPEREKTQRQMRCEGLQRVLAGSGIELSVEELLWGYDQCAQWLQEVWTDNRETTDLEQIRFIIRTASDQTEDLPRNMKQVESLQEAYSRPLLDILPSLNKGAIEALTSVRKRIPRVGLISNVGRSPGRTLRMLLGRLGILPFLDVAVFSDEVGWRKPDGRIFRWASRALSTPPEKIIHIGDHPEADVWGAKQAGMRAILLEYEVPEAFKSNPNSLLTLSRARRGIQDSAIKPDARIRELSQVLDAIESLQ